MWSPYESPIAADSRGQNGLCQCNFVVATFRHRENAAGRLPDSRSPSHLLSRVDLPEFAPNPSEITTDCLQTLPCRVIERIRIGYDTGDAVLPPHSAPAI